MTRPNPARFRKRTKAGTPVRKKRGSKAKARAVMQDWLANIASIKPEDER